jgi:thioredoxin reductase (NADPH)
MGNAADGILPERPVILVSLVSDTARAAVFDQLERRYGADYRVVATAGREAARAELAAAFERGERVALVLADEAQASEALAASAASEVSEVSDVAEVSEPLTVFDEARLRFPDVRRGLVIEWGSWSDAATSETVLRLMASTRIDYYVVRPRHTPDESFHRGITEFLLEWNRSAGTNPLAVAVIGDDDQPRTHALRAYLARNAIPHRLVVPGSDEGLRLLDEAAEAYDGRPLVRLSDGRLLRDPDLSDVAAAAGLSTALPKRTVDLAIVGAGPSGLAAAVYAASEGLSTVVLERDAIGGQAGSSSLIRNYLGFSRGVSGAELSQRAYQQAWVFGATFAHTREAVGMHLTDGGFRIAVSPGDEVSARSVVLACGVSYRRLELGDLNAFVGTAVFYGASSVEAKAQSGRIVHVVGGGNSAGQAALHLARYAKSVSLIVRGALSASMSQYLIDQLQAAGVQVLSGKKVVGGSGSPLRLETIVLRDRNTGQDVTVPCDALFITIGAAPHTEWLPDSVLRDRWGSVITGSEVITEGGRRAWPFERPPGPLESSVPGLFAVGDVRRGSVKRVASAVGEGSVVVSAVHAFLAESRERQSVDAAKRSGPRPQAGTAM